LPHRAADEADRARGARRGPDADEHVRLDRRPHVCGRVRHPREAVADQAVDDGSPRRRAGVSDPSSVDELRERLAQLEAREAEHRRSETVQAALYRIAETASAAQDMQEFYGTIHGIVRELMYADNLYIALYDADRQLINFPYFVDEVDLDVPEPNLWEPYGIGNASGLTAYLLRTGRPMLLTTAEVVRLVDEGTLDLIGVPSVDWVGAPLRSEDRTIGAIVVQSYREDTPHTEADLELLTFVAQHVASALERTRLIDETRQRSAELALVN